MTSDEIIKLAEQAGYCAASDTLPPFYPWLHRFADLVAQHEREACAKVAEGFEQNRDWVRGSLYESLRNEVAARIRARGKAAVKDSLTVGQQAEASPIPDRLNFAGTHAVGGHSGHGGGLD